MARASRIVESPDSNSDEPQSTYTPQSSKRRKSKVQVTASIPSPVSPDKVPSTSEIEDGAERISMSTQGSFLLSESSRNKRPADHVIGENPRQRRRTVEPDGDNSDENYDPDQDIEERRIIRKGLRDLNKDLLENRSEYMNPNSSGLEDTITRANNLSRQVKQTSDATIDSHLLVTAADLTYKRTVAIVSGETGQGIDLDDLINRCKVFMRQGDEERTRLNTSRNERITKNRNEDGDEDNEDEILNWGYLGRNACAQCIGRPCLPGFLLGPLSTEKKAKRTVVRKAALKISSIKESRPEVLREEDIIRDEDLNLSTMCQRITTQLEKVRGEAIAAAESETLDEMTDHEVEMLLDKYNLSREGGISLFNFVINPHSFGQSVENLFYVSFLIRDGKMAISLDSRGIPYLELRDDCEDSNRLDGPMKRYQAVLALDMASWKQLIEIFKINETIIPNREEPEVQNLGAKGCVFPSSYRAEEKVYSQTHAQETTQVVEHLSTAQEDTSPVPPPPQQKFEHQEPHKEPQKEESVSSKFKEETFIQEESRPYKYTKTELDVQLPSHSHHSEELSSEAPRRRRTYRQYHESEIDVAEREYRTRYNSAPREDYRVSHNTEDQYRNAYQNFQKDTPISSSTINLNKDSHQEVHRSSEHTVVPPKIVKPSNCKTNLKEKVVHHPTPVKMGFSDDKCGRPAAEPAYTHNTVTIPCHHIRVGDLLILQGRPCQVIRITTSSATGQHRYLGVDLFTKQLHEESSFISNPSPSVVVQTMLGPVFKQYRVLDLHGNSVVAMTETGDVKQSIPVLDQSGLLKRLTEAFETGRGSVRVLVISDGGRELAVDMKIIHGSRL